MGALSPAALVGAAQSFVGFREETGKEHGRDQGKEQGKGRGQIVERFLAELREASEGDWSAAFIHHVGYWSHYDWLGAHSAWPLPLGNCQDLAAFAMERKVLTSAPAFGDLFVQYSPAQRTYVRAGIILGVTDVGTSFLEGIPTVECEVIEGNSTMTGMLGGSAIVRVRRKLRLRPEEDRVVRWTALASRHTRRGRGAKGSRAAGTGRTVAA